MQFAHPHILGVVTPKSKGQDLDLDCHSAGGLLDLCQELSQPTLVLALWR